MSAPRMSAAALRREFDQRFASPVEAFVRPREKLITAWSSGVRVAFSLADIARVQRAPSIRPVPGGPPSLVGLSSMIGRVVPVFDLAKITTNGTTDARRAYVAVTATQDPVGLLISGDIAYVEVSDDTAQMSISSVRPYVRRIACAGSARYSLLDVQAIIASIAIERGALG